MRYLKFILIIVILITDTLTCFGQNSTEVPPIIQQQDNLYYELLYKDGEFTNEVNVVGWSDSITELVVPDSIEIVVPDSLLQIKNPAFKNIVPTGLGDDWPKPGDGSTRRCKIITFFPNKRFVAVPVPAPKQNISLIDLAKSLRIEGNFRDFVNLKSITLPNVKEIPDSMFMGCNALGELTIPKSVKYIHGYAFAECRNLKTVNINEGLHIIGRAFNECTSLEYVEIQGSQRRIDINSTAFYYCSNLKSLTLGKGVQRLRDWAFFGCDNLSSLYILNPEPPTPYFQKEEDSIFPDYILNNTSLFVPDESLEAYKESSLWGKFNIISGLSAKIESIDIDNDKDTISNQEK